MNNLFEQHKNVEENYQKKNFMVQNNQINTWDVDNISKLLKKYRWWKAIGKYKSIWAEIVELSANV